MAFGIFTGFARRSNLNPKFRFRWDLIAAGLTKRRLRKTADLVLDASEKAMRRVTNKIKKESQRIVPIGETRNLHDAAFTKVKRTRNIVDGEVAYDTRKAPYAMVQHETQWFAHAAGRRWKFLQEPLMKNENAFRAITAQAIRRKLKLISTFR